MSITDAIKEHPEASIALGVVGVLFIAGSYMRNKNQQRAQQAQQGPQDLSGLLTDQNGNHLVYVPTQTSFETQNIGAQFSNDPNLTSITTGSIVTNSPVSQTQNNTNNGGSQVINPPPTPAPPKPPVITPAPPPTHAPPPPPPARYGIVWGAKHTVTSDDTNHGSGALAYIASKSTAIMQQQQHAPSSAHISAGDIVAHNPGLRTNSILRLGQVITLPSWARVS